VTRATGHTGAVTLVQHFGRTLKLNVHLHKIFVDGVSVTGGAGRYAQTSPEINS
jgi:Putative transposase